MPTKKDTKQLGKIEYSPDSEGGAIVTFTISKKKFIEKAPENACNSSGVPCSLWLRQFICNNAQSI